MAYHDLFKTGNFTVQLKNQTHLEFFIQEATIPGITVGTIEVPVAGGLRDYRPGDSLSFNPLTLTVLCDEDLRAFKDVYDYILHLTHNPVTNNIEIDAEVFDAYLMLTTNKNNVKHRIHFHDMWIENITDLQLQTISGDENSISFTLGLRYNYYLLETV